MIQLKTHFFLFLLLAILASCKEDDDKPDKPNYGIQYFECKINGEPFQAVSIPFQCNGPRFDYYPEPFMGMPEGYMAFGGIHCPTYNAVAIRIFGYERDTGYFNFVNPIKVDSISPYYSFDADSLSPRILYENLIEGNMMINEIIPRASGNSPFGTIKGTFEFTVTDEEGIDTIHVTGGSFRFDVPQIF